MLKAAAAVATLFVMTATPVRAGILLTRAIRDRGGSVIAGARVIAFDAAGNPVGSDVALADGTFAIDARAAPATATIACDFCRTLRVRLKPDEPVIAIVERFSAVVADAPSAADIRALPYRSAADLASLRPFTVVDGDRIIDRGLDENGSVRIDSVPFYRAADGGSFSELVPAGATTALSATSPLLAPIYGGYATGGIYDLELQGADAPSRFDAGSASDLAVRAQTAGGGALYTGSDDADEHRQAAAADIALPFAGGQLRFAALDLSDPSTHASGAGLIYATDSRRFVTAISANAMQSADASLVTASARIGNRGPLGLEFGARTDRATGDVGTAGATQFDAAIFADAVRRTGNSTLSLAVAWDHGSDAGMLGGSHAAGVVSSFGDDLRLNAHWTVHAGAATNLRIPAFAELVAAAPADAAGDRSALFEESLTYADLQRVRLTGIAYTQRSTGIATGHVNGIGMNAAWQIAPLLSLRTWLLRANQSTSPAPYAPAADDLSGPPNSASALTRQLVWLSYDNVVRIDALVRGGAIEGDVRIPLGPTYAIAIGSARYDGRRVTTVGVTRR